jgi:cytoskeletal protein CcmA (bactofilin family)
MAAPIAPPAEPAPRAARAVNMHADTSEIGRNVVLKGEVSGTDSLYVDGRIEGTINLPGSRVTIGPNGQVHAHMSVCITAREIVVMGKIHGNVSASDRVDLRAEGVLVGDVSAARISIEDGAYFKGGVDLHKAAPRPEPPAMPEPFKPEAIARPEPFKPEVPAQPEAAKPESSAAPSTPAPTVK